MATRLREVAQRAGVSVATASRVLSGRADGVSVDRRVAVLDAARALHYVPNAHAQALAGAATGQIGAILHDVSDSYFSEILRGVQRAASDADRLLTVCNSYRDPERELAYVALLCAHRVEALILTGSGLDDRAYSARLAGQVAAFAATGGRAVFIGRHHVAGDAILPDNAGGARALARALVGLGHRRFALISGPPLLTATRDRLDGFRAGLAEFGLAVEPDAVVEGGFTREGGVEAMREILERRTEATCIVALNDAMALGALRVLRARGIAVPGELSIAGFDDIPATLDTFPTLSTVRLPMVEMGSLAVELALAPLSDELRVRYLPTEVVLRESTAPPSRLEGAA
jgi:LacI family transcriptional regulator